ncbi:MAG: cbb3-type cytochrome c oxidase subunit I [Thermoleophilia bacterium]|nr:cbb3-type cytochrome c oxidase subunit I [Thermoleophilia bacterium]
MGPRDEKLVPYASQRVAYWYFVIAMALFMVQMFIGLWLAISYAFTIPQGIVDVLPFGLTRAMHTNLLVLWMLLGFMGGAYYLVPEEARREIYSVKLAYIQLVAFVAVGVTALVGFAFGWTQGRPILEIPTPLDFVVVAGALLFLFNVGMTVIKGKKTAVLGMLTGGLVFLALLYVFGMPFYRNLTIDWFYWWWVVHFWVEGAWELVTAAILAFVLIKITGVNRRVVEKYLYIEAALFMFTGIAGIGHHYYWIGAPRFWLWIGGIFSAAEVLPIIAMVIDSFLTQRHSGGAITHKVVWLFAAGTAVGHLVGAGIFGFAHTLPQINYWTHGSQITVSHGHLAFFGAYALLNMAMFWYAVPRLRGISSFRGITARWGFWVMCFSMLGMGLAMSVAGILQTYIERVMGQGFMTAQAQMQFWFKITLFFGVFLIVGVGMTFWNMLTARQAPE